MLFEIINVMIIMDFSQNNQKKSPKKEKIGIINSRFALKKVSMRTSAYMGQRITKAKEKWDESYNDGLRMGRY